MEFLEYGDTPKYSWPLRTWPKYSWPGGVAAVVVEAICVFERILVQRLFEIPRDTVFDTPYRQTVFTRVKNVCS